MRPLIATIGLVSETALDWAAFQSQFIVTCFDYIPSGFVWTMHHDTYKRFVKTQPKPCLHAMRNPTLSQSFQNRFNVSFQLHLAH